MSGRTSTNKPITIHVQDNLDTSDLMYGVDFSPIMPSSATISSPTVSGIYPPGITIGSLAVNSAQITDNDGTTTIAANKGVVFKVTTASPNVTYYVTIKATVNSVSTLAVTVPIRVEQ